MTDSWDEFTKTLAQPVPRRESLRQFSLVFAGALFSPLGLAAAFAKGPPVKDPCDTFCRCRGKTAQSQCQAACRACRDAGGQLCGSCGNYSCCASGEVCCGNTYCTELASDFGNCGACGYECAPPGPWELGACIDGRCEYWCADYAVDCQGVCAVLELDDNNCGACGNVCPEETPYCVWGVCSECPGGQTKCDGVCVDLNTDVFNCGACGYVCSGPNEYCDGGVCVDGGGPWVDPGPAP